MNQILVTEKLYVTPELKRKKKIYKFCFIMSVLVVIVLCGMYFFNEYNRNTEDRVTQDLMAGWTSMSEENSNSIEEDKETEKVWKIIVASRDKLEQEQELEQENGSTSSNSENNSNNSSVGNSSQTTQKTTKYTASDGKTYDMVGKIKIKSINVDEVILSETTEALLKISPCRFYGPENPNEVGNFCIAGHNYRNTRFFSKVPNLVVGDIIEITDMYGNTVKYSVYDKYTVAPENTSCLNQNTKGKKIVTLITCTNDSKQRVIVQAKEI